MDSAAMGSSSMKLDNKRAPYAAGPLRQKWCLHIRVTPVRCLADIPEPRFGTAERADRGAEWVTRRRGLNHYGGSVLCIEGRRRFLQVCRDAWLSAMGSGSHVL